MNDTVKEKYEYGRPLTYSPCTLCARMCRAARDSGGRGACRMGCAPVIARAALHMWEEPPISGTRGAGAVFFSGCSLGCIYCQNREISRGESGIETDIRRLSEIFFELRAAGAHNIDLVTPTHFAPSVIAAIDMARSRGFDLPFIWNTSSYDTRETIRALAGRVDIFLPDLKYSGGALAEKYSAAPDYPAVARAAIEEMMRISPTPVYDNEGIMMRGVIARILLLPGRVAEAKRSVAYLYHTYGDNIVISLMSQYTPLPNLPRELSRPVSREEYRDLCDYAMRIGVTNAFIQEGGAAAESFIPPFDNTGVLPRE